MADDKTKIDEEKKKEFSERTNQLISLTILLLTICATFSSLYAGANSRNGILAQNQATDFWSHYQAKSIKQTIYRSQLEWLEVDTSGDPEKSAALVLKYKSEIERYEREKNEIKTNAMLKSVERDKRLSLNRGFASAVTFLQISIMLVSLATLLKQHLFWYAGSALGSFGIFCFVKTMLAA